MRNFRRFRTAPFVALCLLFTGGGVARAERHTADLYIEDPYAPHKTNGSEARLGTAVGFLYNEPVDVTALGAAVAMGYRFGRLTVESEFTYLGFQVRGPDDTALGAGERLAFLGRFDVIRLGPRIVGQNSLLSIYVEGGAGSSWNHWYRPAYDEHSRIVPADTRRSEGQIGFGISIDHRLQEPIGFPHRVGWFLGWRMAMSPHQPMSASVCRGVSCKPIEMQDEDNVVDRSMLFQSSLAFTF
ncbi:MAG TPA: hypothetical protein VL326_34600 [Kofleriaceae bacterium]|jgi:hypothetical protein|nr:hypothetical protein [Kofleriaceae bacterium]